jgi:hypothetical protein
VRRTGFAAALIGAAWLVVGCGGGGTKAADPIGVAVGMMNTPPSEVQKGTTVEDELTFFATDDEGVVAGYGVVFTDKDELTHEASFYVYRSEEAAQQALDAATDGYDDIGLKAPKDKAGLRCAWDDLVEETVCMGRSGVVEVENYTYSEDDDSPDEDALLKAGTDFTKALLSYAQGISKKSEKVDRVPVKALPALLAAVQPPNGPGGARTQQPSAIENDELLDKYKGARQVRWYSTDKSYSLWFLTFSSKSDASAYLKEYYQGLSKVTIESGDATCVKLTDQWVCGEVADEVVSLVVHNTTSGEEDEDAAKYASDGAAHAKSLRSGDLPREPKDSSGSSKIQTGTTPTTRGPTSPPPSPTATATPTPVPINAINSGTWTFDITVRANTCGGEPAVGSPVTVEYEFTEAGRDYLISKGELFGIEQTFPNNRDFGVFTMSLPRLLLQLPLSSGGTGILTLDFIAVDEADVQYVVDYGNCKITASN